MWVIEIMFSLPQINIVYFAVLLLIGTLLIERIKFNEKNVRRLYTTNETILNLFE